MTLDLKPWLPQLISDFIDRSPANNLGDNSGERAWDRSLVGFARGDDPLFASYKDHVGPFHFTPEELFNQTFPDRPARPEELAVLVWLLPQRDQVKADNSRARKWPAERWARVRIFGERFNEALRAHVVDQLAARGVAAVAPMLSPLWQREVSPQYGFASRWSERHAAFAAGLGTFGLCDGLITPVGKAVRIGSVIARHPVQPDPRPYRDRHQYCLHFSHGLCGECIDRCPVGALSRETGHDKIKCRAHLRPASIAYVKKHYGFDGYGCGLCQTGVPCESGIPRPPKAADNT